MSDVSLSKPVPVKERVYLTISNFDLGNAHHSLKLRVWDLLRFTFPYELCEFNHLHKLESTPGTHQGASPNPREPYGQYHHRYRLGRFSRSTLSIDWQVRQSH